MSAFQPPSNHHNNGPGTSRYEATNNYGISEDNSLIAIAPLFKTLWQRKGLIALVTAIFVGLTFLYITITPSTYTARGVIVIDPRQVQVLDSEAAISSIGANSAAIASQVEIIQSRTLVQKVFIEQGYANDPEFAKPRLLSRIFGIFLQPAPMVENRIFNNFWNRLGVERQGLTYVISVSFKTQNAQKSAEIVNAIIATYMGSQIEERSDANAQVSILLSNQMEGLRAELARKEAAVEAFKEQFNILSTSTGSTLLQNQIEQLSAQLVVARELARAANNRHLQVSGINASTDNLTSLFEILTDSSNTLRANYTQSSMELSSLQARLGPRHPNLLVASAELSRLENLIRNEAHTVLTQISSEKDLAQTNVENAELELIALRVKNSVSNQNHVALRDLQRQAEATRQVLEQLIGREQETEQLENLQRSDARVISEAVAPTIATWPKATLLLAVAMILGLGLGSAVALFLGLKTPRNAMAKQGSMGVDPNTNHETGHVTPACADQYQSHPDYAYANHGDGFDNQTDHFEIPRSHYYPAQRSRTGPTNPPDGPIYHSSELERDMPVQANDKDYAQDYTRDYANSTPPRFPDEEREKDHLNERQNPGFSVQSASTKLWERRAAGHPYSAPASAGSHNTQFSTQNPSQTFPIGHQHFQARQNHSGPTTPSQNPTRNPTRNPTNDGLTRQSFVSELKKRLNQNAPR